MTDAPTPRTIVVADSEVRERMVISAYLRECGYRVLEAASEAEAANLLEQADWQVDVLLCDTDLGEPGRGFALVSHARVERPDLKVILTHSLPQTAQAAAELCDEGPVASRPYDPQLVADRIKRMLAGHP